MGLKVLHVISAIDPEKGGPIAALQGLLEAQVRAGLDVSLAATWARGHNLAMAQRFRDNGIHVHLMGPTVDRLASWHPKIKRVLRQSVPAVDVVHIHALWEEIQHQAARMACRASRPYLITPHGMLTQWAFTYSTLKKRLYLAWRARRNLVRARAIHFTTSAEQHASQHLGLPTPSFVEPLGLDLSEFQNLPPRGSFRQQWPTLAGKRVVLFLGRIHPGKGLEHLVPALAQAAMPDVLLVVVGPDSRGFKSQILGLIDKHRLREQVLFVGPLSGPEKVAALRDADLLALPSDHENFGLVVVEALAAQTPVLISDQVNICNEIATAQVGAVVPIDIGRIAFELRRWLTDEALRRSAADKARDFVWQHYDWNAIARNWINHYQRVLDSQL